MNSDKKMEFSKAAICKVIDSLNIGDVVSCIAYDNKVEVVFYATKIDNNTELREELKKKVSAIDGKGSTNISLGLTCGAFITGAKPTGKYLTKQAAGDMSFLLDVPRAVGGPELKRVFLFSDGSANAGLKSASELGYLNASMLTLKN